MLSIAACWHSVSVVIGNRHVPEVLIGMGSDPNPISHTLLDLTRRQVANSRKNIMTYRRGKGEDMLCCFGPLFNFITRRLPRFLCFIYILKYHLGVHHISQN